MESTPYTITFPARVAKVEEKKHKNWIKGYGQDAIFEEISLGWFISLLGSYESLCVGSEKPSIHIGDYATVRITFHGPTPQAHLG